MLFALRISKHYMITVTKPYMITVAMLTKSSPGDKHAIISKLWRNCTFCASWHPFVQIMIHLMH